MIVKSIGAKGSESYGRCISYFLRDGAVLRGSDNELITIRHNVFGTPREIKEQFIENNERRLNHRVNANALLHVIMAFSGKNKEDVTPEMLIHLSHEFIRMVDPDCLAYGALHMDGNPHSHILISASNMLGHSTRISRDEFQRIKQELQAIQMRDYPELGDSVVEHGGGHMAKSEAEYQIGRAGRVSRKEELKDLLTVSFELSNSREEFFNLLSEEEGIAVYERGGQVKGIEDSGKHYRFQTLNIDLEVLDKRMERLDELESLREDKEIIVDEIEMDDESVENQRMRELDELE